MWPQSRLAWRLARLQLIVNRLRGIVVANVSKEVVFTWLVISTLSPTVRWPGPMVDPPADRPKVLLSITGSAYCFRPMSLWFLHYGILHSDREVFKGVWGLAMGREPVIKLGDRLQSRR